MNEIPDLTQQRILYWQNCPHCGGWGKEPTGYYFVTVQFTIHDCSVCKGKKIISTITGKPPGE